MIVIKTGLKRNRYRYFKPRRCPDCHCIAFFCRNWGSQRCTPCHNRRRRKIQGRKQLYKHGYQKRRKRVIAAHPYCALCGTTKQLTTHHVGGGMEYLTVLCEPCHSNYERQRQKSLIMRGVKNGQ